MVSGFLMQLQKTAPPQKTQQVAAALSAAVTTAKLIRDAPTSQAEPPQQKYPTQTPAALRERGVWGERRFSLRSGLSPQNLHSPTSLREGARGRGLLYREAPSLAIILTHIKIPAGWARPFSGGYAVFPMPAGYSSSSGSSALSLVVATSISFASRASSTGTNSSTSSPSSSVLVITFII